MQPKRILVAEDELHMRLTLEIIIERLGYMPLFATNGEEALEKLVQNQIDSTPIDLLLCDIQMPGMDGTELIETMRKRKIETPILVITGFGDKNLLIQLMRMGCRDFIDKPFSPDQIEERLKILLADINSREAEEQRQTFMARIGESAQSYIHDINNALSGVHGYADMLMNDIPPGHPLHSRISKLFSTATRAVEICRELLSNALPQC